MRGCADPTIFRQTSLVIAMYDIAMLLCAAFVSLCLMQAVTTRSCQRSKPAVAVNQQRRR